MHCGHAHMPSFFHGMQSGMVKFSTASHSALIRSSCRVIQTITNIPVRMAQTVIAQIKLSNDFPPCAAGHAQPILTFRWFRTVLTAPRNRTFFLSGVSCCPLLRQPLYRSPLCRFPGARRRRRLGGALLRLAGFFLGLSCRRARFGRSKS